MRTMRADYEAAARHATAYDGEMRGAFQTYRGMTEFGKHLEVAAGSAAKI